MKSARTRGSAVSLLVSISVASTVCAGVSRAVVAEELPGVDGFGAFDAEACALGECTCVEELGDLAVAAGLMFALPQGAASFDAPGLDAAAWIDEEAGLFVAAIPQVATGTGGISLGTLVAAATDLSIAMGGRVTGFSVYDNASAAVYMYDVAFTHAGAELHGTLGFVPLENGTLSALVTICRAPAAENLAPVVQRLYAGVDLAW